MSVLFARIGQGFGASGGAIDIIAGGYVSSSVNGQAYTIPQTWGPEGAGRVLVVMLTGLTNQAGSTALNVSIAGIPCTMLIQKSQLGGGGACSAELWAAVVPTGVAGNVVVNLAQAQFNLSTQVLTLYNVNSIVPTFVGSAGQASGTVLTVPGATVVAGGAILAWGCGTSTAAWTGFAPLTQAGTNGIIEAVIRTGSAWDLADDYASGSNVTLTQVASDRQALVVASLR